MVIRLQKIDYKTRPYVPNCDVCGSTNLKHDLTKCLDCGYGGLG